MTEMPQDDPVVAYKHLLRDIVDRRPSGTRRKLAQAFGTHPSFISQLTNPALKVPLPAQHIPTLFGVCHCTKEEREQFLLLYRRAHPAQSTSISELAAGERNVIKIVVPQFADPQTGAEVEAAIREFAERIIRLASGRGRSKSGEPK
jgi:hypothetical protein